MYLRHRVARRVLGRNLRASAVSQLTVPHTNVSAVADQCFSVFASSYWNHLSPARGLARGYSTTFKKRLLKTRLFSDDFGQDWPGSI